MGLALFRRKVEDRTLTPESLPAVMLPDVGEVITGVDQVSWPQVADVFACVRLLTDAVSTLPLEAYRNTPDGRVEVGPDARISQLLARPFPGCTLPDLLGQIMQSLAVDGNCFIGKWRGADGSVVQLGVFDPQMVQIRLMNQVIIYTVGYYGGSIETGPEDILHIRGSVSLDHLRGVSPIMQCAMAMGLNASLSASAKKFQDQGSRPSGVLAVKGGQSDFTVAKIQESWQDSHGGATNMHKIAVLQADEVTYQQLGLSAEDAQFIQQRELSTREIARIFRVPAHMIDGDTGRSLTYSTVEQQGQFFLTHSLRPWLVRIETAISMDPDLCPGNTYVRFDVDSLLRASALERAQVYTAALNPQTGWLTRAEVRELENLEPETNLPATGETD
jgi:HK97 family phage portal protein